MSMDFVRKNKNNNMTMDRENTCNMTPETALEQAKFVRI
jgi:hypothetical protein